MMTEIESGLAGESLLRVRPFATGLR